MNRIIAIVGLLVLVLLGGGGFYFYQNYSKKLSESSQNQEVNTDVSQMSSKKTLADLIKLDKNQMCVFKDKETNSEGVLYVSNSNFRGDFKALVEEQEINSHIIADNDYIYIWTDEGDNMGFKYSIAKALGEEEGYTSSDSSSPIDLNEQVDYECSDWNVDASMFYLPTEIEFQSLESVVEDSLQQAGMDKETMCQTCDNLPEESQASCRQNLGC